MKELKVIKVVSCNAYTKNGKVVFVMTFDNDTKVFINGGLICYAGNHAKETKNDQNK